MPLHPDTHSQPCADESGTPPHPKVEGRPDLPRAQTCTADLRLHSLHGQIDRADAEPAPDPDVFRDDLLRLLPELRHFARSVTQAAEKAEDLVQETLLRAWQSQDQYRSSNDLKAWAFAMMRNSILSHRRDMDRELPDPGMAAAERPAGSVN
ncbi:sigma-70 family RNA polymerase sigma factor [Methylobacterium sp. P5_C11]